MNAPRARAVLALARIEAWRLGRGGPLLAGFLFGGLLVWSYTHGTQPVWWNGAWSIGYGQTALSAMALIAAQLAAGRARRDGMAPLYASLPSGAARRTAAQLIGVLGAAPAAVVLIGVVSGVFALHGVVGSPDVAALIGGVLLVLAGGAIGVALGARFPHPLAGVLGAFAWIVPFTQSNRFSGPVTWLFPWIIPAQLRQLPGPLAGYPPSLVHALELAAVTVLAGALALAASAPARRARAALFALGAAALAGIVASCVVQMQPIPASDVQNLVNQVTNAGAARHCTQSGSVRYCLYPQFEAKTAALRPTVDTVLEHVPAQRGRTLTIAQFTGLSADDAILTDGHSGQDAAAWQAELVRAPANQPSSSALYVNLGSWPIGGSDAADARFDLALGTAAWAVGLPTNTGPLNNAVCVPVDQAREAIAIWLAAQAEALPPAPFQDTGGGITGDEFAQVDGALVVTWSYPGEGHAYGDYLASPGAQTTAAGFLLAQAMTKLPTARISAVLAADWSSWTDPDTTDARLAGALGIAMPEVPTGLPGPHGQTLAPPPGAIPAQPECGA